MAFNVREVLLWDGNPFFYYEKHCLGPYNGILYETRIYIENDLVIRKLNKETEVDYYTESLEDFYDFQASSSPNIIQPITGNEMETIKSFIDSCKDWIKEQLEE